MAEEARRNSKATVRTKGAQMQALSICLTQEQKEAISDFWHETGSVGTVEIQVEVVGDRISPASIQVGTAK